ncbi:MAG: S66 peptidase family protein, partial [Eubacteriales bacterium]
MLKLPKIKPGSRVAVVAPSSGTAEAFPGIYNLGVKNIIHFLGLVPVAFPTATMSSRDLYLNPKKRAEDINAAFADETIDAIFYTIGGYESVRILEYLNKEVIMANPKTVMGFSDATAFLTLLNQWGMPALYGPSVMAGIAQLDYLPDEALTHLKTMLFECPVPYTYEPYDEFTHSYKDWSDESVLGQLGEMHTNTGPLYMLGETPTEGQLWGGCIEVLHHDLNGTRYWPGPDFFDGKILFLETSEDKPTPMQVGYMVRNLASQGILSRISGLLFGRPKDYT